MTRRTSGAASAIAASRAEDLLELVRRGDLELVVTAVLGPLVETPALENRRVTEARTLHVVVLDLAHALDPQRLPRQIFTGAPAAPAARHARRVTERLGPVAPGVVLECSITQRCELERELLTHRHREG